MLLKSNPLSFKAIVVEGKNEKGDSKSLSLFGLVTIKNNKARDSFELHNDRLVFELKDIHIKNVNAADNLAVAIDDPGKVVLIDKIGSDSSVSLLSKSNVNVGIVENRGMLSLLNESQAKIGKVRGNGSVVAYDNAKTHIEELHGSYVGKNQSKNETDKIYSGASMTLAEEFPASKTINSQERPYSTVNATVKKDCNPITLKLFQKAMLLLPKNLENFFRIELNDDSTLFVDKVLSTNEDRRSRANTSVVKIYNNAQFRVKSDIKGNVDFSINADKPMRYSDYSLLSGGEVDKNVKITQAGVSKTSFNKFEGQLQLLDKAFTFISDFNGILDMGKKLIYKDSDSPVDNERNKNNSSADIERVGSEAKINLSDQAILRYKEMHENALAQLTRDGFLKKGSYHQVKNFD